MNERSIDYLCNLLEAEERAAFETLFAADVNLATELQRLSRMAAWLEAMAESAAPPPDLAERIYRRLFAKRP